MDFFPIPVLRMYLKANNEKGSSVKKGLKPKYLTALLLTAEQEHNKNESNNNEWGK